MEKTLYISDLDGTLLNSDSVISDTSCRILNKLIADNRNVLFSVATARTPATVVQLMQNIHSPLPYIVMTGAAMWQKSGLVNRCYLPTSDAELILSQCSHYGIHPFLYTYNEESNIIDAYHSPTMDFYERNFVEQRTGTAFKRFLFTDEIPQSALSKVMLIFAAAKFEKIQSLHKDVAPQSACSMTCYRDIFDFSTGFLEVMGENVSKAAAVSRLASDVGASRIVVFGDSPNDLSMKSVASLFVAPCNASQEVCNVADAITDSNNNDCVAHWIAADAAAQQACCNG